MPESENQNTTSNTVVQSTQSSPPSPTQTPSSNNVTGSGTNSLSNSQNSKFPKKSKKLAIITIIVILILSLGSAGAYFGIVVPNKPQNVLTKAATKLLLDKQVSSTGKISFEGDESNYIKGLVINFTSKADYEKQAFDVNFEGSFTGVKLPVDVRMIDKNYYFRVGDIGSIESLLRLSAGEEMAATVGALGESLSNKWIVVDESMVKQANFDCFTDLSSGYSKDDVDQIINLYKKNKFLDVKNKSKEDLSGAKTTKYVLGVNKDKAEEFSDKINEVGYFKKLNECSKKASGQSEQSSADNSIKETAKDSDVEISVWVDKSKNIKQIELKATVEKVTTVILITITDEAINIEKPSDATPLMEVLGGLSSLYSDPAFLGEPEYSQTLGASTKIEFSNSCSTQISNYIKNKGTSSPPSNCL